MMHWALIGVLTLQDFLCMLTHWGRTTRICVSKLEQLERLRSEDSPRHPMITHTIDSY